MKGDEKEIRRDYALIHFCIKSMDESVWSTKWEMEKWGGRSVSSCCFYIYPLLIFFTFSGRLRFFINVRYV